MNESDFKWIWKVPDLRTVKQPETVTPDEFIDLVERIDNERLDPLVCARNQGFAVSRLSERVLSGLKKVE